jgi:hypothetical protein
MNHIHWSLFLQLVSISSTAQDDIQTSIQSRENIFTISRQEGFDMIFFKPVDWDNMVSGTKYSSTQIPPNLAIPVYIQISCKSSACSSGIGFTCSIFDRLVCEPASPVIVNHQNRFSAALIRKQPGGTIELLLLDTIDWVSLRSKNDVASGDE